MVVMLLHCYKPNKKLTIQNRTQQLKDVTHTKTWLSKMNTYECYWTERIAAVHTSQNTLFTPGVLLNSVGVSTSTKSQ
jgi:hypothetical protein